MKDPKIILAGGGDSPQQTQQDQAPIIVVTPQTAPPKPDNGFLAPEYIVPVLVAIIGVVGAVWAAKHRSAK